MSDNSFDLAKAAANLHDLQKVGEAIGLHSAKPKQSGPVVWSVTAVKKYLTATVFATMNVRGRQWPI